MDPHVELARRSLERLVAGAPLEEVPPDLAPLIPPGPRACFVSLHGPDGSLRGCMGTLEPTEPQLALEILRNARVAASRDRRFDPVRAEELPGLQVGVDVLSPLEAVAGPEALDPRHYGAVLSTRDGRQGVLLPDLPGVDTVEDQVAIVRRKAGIREGEPVRIQRFTVERHG